MTGRDKSGSLWMSIQCAAPVFLLFLQEEKGQEGAEDARGERERRAGEAGQDQSRVGSFFLTTKTPF